MFESLKELIKSTAKATTAALQKELRAGLETNQRAIRSVKEDVESLRIEMHGIRDDLRSEIRDTRSEMKNMETRLTDKLASKEEMNAMEVRLSDKIDTRIDDHESKPAGIAHKAA